MGKGEGLREWALTATVEDLYAFHLTAAEHRPGLRLRTRGPAPCARSSSSAREHRAGEGRPEIMVGGGHDDDPPGSPPPPPSIASTFSRIVTLSGTALSMAATRFFSERSLPA